MIVGSLNATGRLFHAVGPATENARRPYVVSLIRYNTNETERINSLQLAEMKYTNNCAVSKSTVASGRLCK